MEGIHYSIMFYGGRLAAHLSGAVDAKEVEGFISLRRLNRRGVMLIDSDRDKPRKPINATKLRLRDEFDSGPGHAWITDGREIENYLTPTQVADAVLAIHPGATIIGGSTKYDHMLSIRSATGKVGAASKVDVARYISEKYEPDFEILDLKKQIQALRSFILASNPKVTSPTASS